ncbi:transporter [Pedobacter ginsenosidimutans]|uniref:Transporter n=1 Tax=Pedobacter ginsenosidimutans TaxID=687842 RepID=A0A0T5VW42_9SPHI|nr:DUF6691 family protein [Pedobacter ginsenosidimutans]KRT17865.1 transporter [Pedobacter ginsenosidimutans]
MKSLIYVIIGTFFGIVMYKSEAASWFRIYEMFKFQSFHMFGLMGTALFTGIFLVNYIKRKHSKDVFGNTIKLTPKDKGVKRYLIGGIIFGSGWALIGACPGPMFVLAGAGYIPILIVILGALLGTWVYGLIRHKLPH